MALMRRRLMKGRSESGLIAWLRGPRLKCVVRYLLRQSELGLVACQEVKL